MNALRYQSQTGCQRDLIHHDFPHRNVEIVKRSNDQRGFVVLPRRWVIKRTFAWLGRINASATTTNIGPSIDDHW
jgi:transposase|tara:strand:- start:519 stop:743 length:225 start_codon:yes stop_codon:yes gene_type:complete